MTPSPSSRHVHYRNIFGRCSVCGVLLPEGAPAGAAAFPTESTACRAEHHGLCTLPGCPCRCHSESHVSATCPKCGVMVTDQTPSAFYLDHDERCGGALSEPEPDDIEP